LVTGAAGMLGSNLVKEISKSPENLVTGLTRATLDLRNSGALRKVLAEEKPVFLFTLPQKLEEFRPTL
jgi:dTDP-4-dehydrorhamnose reductase